MRGTTPFCTPRLAARTDGRPGPDLLLLRFRRVAGALAVRLAWTCPHGSIAGMQCAYRIRNLEISPGLVLAPMSGVTTSSFRRLIKELNPGCIGMLVSEFISVEAMTRQVARSLQMMHFDPSERPYCIQIFGYDIDRMQQAARMVEDAGADVVDINCGCPAPKVVRKGGGCELMRQPEHLAQVLRAVRRAVKIPLTLKMRSGWEQNHRNAVEIARIAEAEGVEALAVHGRTRVQLYRGDADWDIVREVANAVKIPVCGSGDVVDRASAELRRSGGVAGLFIGRAALFNPFVFREIVTGEPVSLRHRPALAVAILERYIELMLEEFPPQSCVGRLKQLVSQLCRYQEWRKELLRANTFEQQREILQRVRDTLEEEPSLDGFTQPIASVLSPAADSSHLSEVA